MSTRKRKDAYLIKDLDPFHLMVPYIMPRRADAVVSFTKNFDITKLLEYIDNCNKKKHVNIKFFHCICMAVSKTIFYRPKLNIFISGKKFYQRKDITLSFVAKQKFNDESQETLMFLKVLPDMNVYDFSKIILGDVSKAREEGSNSLDKTMNFIGKLPRFILEIVFWFMSKLEYHGMYPQSLAKDDPNYSTVLLSNLGSIHADSCIHHLSNYGTCSMMITIGTIKKNKIKDENEKEIEKASVDLTFNIDERIADGFYFAKSLKYIDYLFNNPELLEKELSSPFPKELE